MDVAARLAGKEAGKKVAQGLASRILRAAAKDGFQEGVTEGLQELVQQGVVSQATGTSHLDLGAVVDAAAAGAAGGVALGAGGEALSRPRRATKTVSPAPPATAAPARPAPEVTPSSPTLDAIEQAIAAPAPPAPSVPPTQPQRAAEAAPALAAPDAAPSLGHIEEALDISAPSATSRPEQSPAPASPFERKVHPAEFTREDLETLAPNVLAELHDNLWERQRKNPDDAEALRLFNLADDIIADRLVERMPEDQREGARAAERQFREKRDAAGGRLEEAEEEPAPTRLPPALRKDYADDVSDAEVLGEELSSRVQADRTPTQPELDARDELERFAESFGASDAPWSDFEEMARAHADETLTGAAHDAFMGAVASLATHATPATTDRGSLDRSLLDALQRSGHRDRIPALREGATDAQVSAFVQEALGTSGSVTDAGWTEARGLLFRWRPDADAAWTTLKGKALVSKARELLAIPQPSGTPGPQVTFTKARIVPTRSGVKAIPISDDAAPVDTAPETAQTAQEEVSDERTGPVRQEAPAASGAVLSGDRAPVAGDRGAGDVPGAGERPGRGPVSGPDAARAEVPDGGDAVRGTRSDTAERVDDGRVADHAGDRPAADPTSERADRAVVTRTVAGENYRITDADALGAGGAATKLQQNLTALRVLKLIESEGREATREEQAALVKYVGWGDSALSKLFDEDSRSAGKLAAERDELKDLLTADEYAAARASTLNAHYTSPTVIRGLWAGLQRLGFSQGRVLEPSAGIGHFLGLAPGDVRATFAAVELDGITGRIARLLYPRADVRVQGFETATFPDDYFDVALSNVPFGNYTLHDPRYNQHKLSIHDYFFVKALDLVRPGGVVAFVTSRYTMDKQERRVRALLAEKADLLGAIRLPNTAFKQNAGTDVTTDVLFLQKREPGTVPGGAKWLTLAEVDTPDGPVAVNEYFATHPDMMLGALRLTGTMYGGKEPTLEPTSGESLARGLARAVEALPRDVLATRAPTGADDTVREPILAPDDVKEGGFVLGADGTILQRQLGVLVDGGIPRTQREKVAALIGLRDVLTQLRHAEITGAADEAVDALREELNAHYDRFVKTYGPINLEKHTEIRRTRKDGTPLVSIQVRTPNLDAFKDDPLAPAVAALENYEHSADPRVPHAVSKAGILLARQLNAPRQIGRVETPAQALPVSLNEKGRVDLPYMAQLADVSEDTLIEALRGQIFQNPATGEWESRDLYLSGNVRVKLAEAEEAARTDARYRENVTALDAIQPKDLTPSQISVTLGAAWVPATDVQDFAADVLQVDAKVSYSASQGTWAFDVDRWSRRSSGAVDFEYGTARKDGVEILRESLGQRKVQVFDTYTDAQGNEKKVLNLEDTLAAQEKQKKLEDAFTKWLWADETRRARLLRLYNDRFNALVWPSYDGSHLALHGTASHINGRAFQFLPTQRAAIWRGILRGNQLLAHVVGAGKTFTMIAQGMEERRLGLIRKPLYVVPNHMLEQFSREFLQLYPQANILVATERDFEKAKRKLFVARMAQNPYDAIVMTHASFGKIPMSGAFQREMLHQQLDELESEIRESKRGSDRQIVKQLEAAKKKLAEKIKRLEAGEGKDRDFLTFEETGVDKLFVDEAHLFKNLWAPTRMRGLPIASSNRAFDLFYKTQYLHRVSPGRGVVFATGTPISNSLVEMFTMQRYLGPDRLRALGIQTIDGWFSNFGRMVNAAELAPDGSGYRMKERPAAFKNLPELSALFREFADVATEEDVFTPQPGQRSIRPPMRGGKPINVTVEPTLGLLAYTRWLIRRGEQVKGKKPEKGGDNILKIFTEGRVAATALRLLSPHVDEGQNAKLDAAVDRLMQEYTASTPHRGTQLVFADVGTPQSHGKDAAPVEVDDLDLAEEQEETETEHDFDAVAERAAYTLYDDLKARLVARGVPAAEIRFIHDAKTAAQKQQLFNDVNAGAVRIVVGSTDKMGAGTNMQRRVVALHNIDTPRSMRPSDLEQREGRAIRQGNLLWNDGLIDGVAIYRYATARSMEANLWDMLARKAKMIVSVMKGDPNTREMEDLDSSVQDLEVMKALASGNPLVLERVALEKEVAELQAASRAAEEERDALRRKLTLLTATTIPETERMIAEAEADRAKVTDTKGDKFTASILGKTYTERKAAGEAVLGSLRTIAEKARTSGNSGQWTNVGKLGGFAIVVRFEPGGGVRMGLQGNGLYVSALDPTNAGPLGLVQSLESLPRSIDARVANLTDDLDRLRGQIPQLEALREAPFEKADALRDKRARLEEVTRLTSEGTGGMRTEFAPMAPENSKAWWALVADGVFPYIEREVPMAPDVPPTADNEQSATGSLLGPHLNFLGLQTAYEALFTGTKRTFAPQTTAALREVEDRWMAARGIPPGERQTLRDRLRRVKEQFQRHFQHLDTAESPAIAATVDVLRQLEGASHWAKAAAVDKVREVIGPLSADQVDVMTRVLVLDDLLRDLEEGKYGEAREDGTYPKPLPFGYPSREAIAEDRQRFTFRAESDAAVREALDRRATFARALTKRLVELDELPAEVLADPRYYHRQVMQYVAAREQRGVGTGSRDVRVRRKGFQKGRTGGGDFNTSYQEAEFEWVAQALSVIAYREGQQKIERLNNIKDSLVRQAKTQNDLAVAQRLADLVRRGDDSALMALGFESDAETADPYKRFRMRLGRHTSALYDALRHGALPDLPRFRHVVRALREQYSDYLDQVGGMRKKDRPPFTFSHPDFFAMLAAIVEADAESPSGKAARGIFAAIRDRERFIDQVLGANRVTWEDLVPDGYALWQPEQGNVFYRAATVAEEAVDRVLAGDKSLQATDVRNALVMGGKKAQWVIPEGLAATLDEFQPATAADGIDSLWTEAEASWKQWTLLSPAKFSKYNLNNLVGDSDIAFAYDPRIFQFAPQALRDLIAIQRGTASPALRAELLDATRRQVLDSGFSLAEVPDINQVGAFRHLTSYEPSVAQSVVQTYWSAVRAFTTTRENVLRLASYRYFQAQIADGRRVYGASKPREVEVISDAKDRAAKLARELIGDYGNISHAGQWVRTHIAPFYSWMEINAPRYVRLLRNLTREEGAPGKVGRAVATKTLTAGASLAIRANVFFLLAALWNRLFWPDEDDELRRNGRELHLILGRRADGSIRSLAIQGAFADALQWVALSDYPADIRDLVHGTASLADKAAEAVKAPLERVVNAWEPVSKTLFEISTGRSTYPTIFEPGASFGFRTRPIRDRAESVARTLSLEWLYDRVAGKPLPPSRGPLSVLDRTLLQRTVPGEAAYWMIREKAAKWNDAHGRGGGRTSDPTDRTSALFYFRQASQWGDEEAAQRWLRRYFELGGDKGDVRGAIKRAAPLGSIPMDERGSFRRSLSPDEQAVLHLADTWYRQSLKAPARTVLRQTLRPRNIEHPRSPSASTPKPML